MGDGSYTTGFYFCFIVVIIYVEQFIDKSIHIYRLYACVNVHRLGMCLWFVNLYFIIFSSGSINGKS